MSEEKEWIPTKEAAELLGVKSTQAVVQLANRHPDELPLYNFGSEEQPRYVLKRADVIRFQEKRNKK